MLVYLGGPIDLVSDKDRVNWRWDMKKELIGREISSFDPCSAFKINPCDKGVAENLVDINKMAMLNCDFAVFVMSREMPSIGTPIELYMASENGLPHVVIWLSDGPFPAYISGLADTVVRNFDDAMHEIIKFRKMMI